MHQNISPAGRWAFSRPLPVKILSQVFRGRFVAAKCSSGTAVKPAARVPQANAFCERVIGTMRRECLDFIIAINEGHVRAILREWVSHYNRGRPHASLGPDIPERPLGD